MNVTKLRFLIAAMLSLTFASVLYSQQPTWTDPATGLMWAKTDNGIDVNWQQAANYCQNLTLGGYSGWRLPTIDELAGIYDQTQNVDGKHIKGGIQMTASAAWSNSAGNVSGEAWNFFFNNGTRWSNQLAFLPARALCVRRSGE